jgi:phospholipid/cholesterol/gamma-HCH transport system substrate-binding protein
LKISKEVKTALLVIIAIFLLVFGYSFLNSKNIFSSNRTFYVTYDDVEGLSGSSKVLVNGYQVGKVENITFATEKEGEILVTLNIQNKFNFSKNSIARIYGGGFIGGKKIAIVPKYDGEMAKAGDTLNGEVEEGLVELVNEKLTPLQKKIESFVSSADSLLTSVNKAFDSTSRTGIKGAIVNLDSTMRNLNSVSENLNEIIVDNSENLDETFENLKTTSENFSQFSDTLNQLEVKRIVGRFDKVAADFEDVANNLKEGKGTAGKLLQDDKVYNNLDRATKQLEELLQDFKLHPKRYVHFSVFGKNAEPYEEPEDSLK